MPGDPGGPSWSDLLQKASPKTGVTAKEAPSNGLSVRDALAIAYGKSYAEHRTVGGRMSPKYGRQIKDKASFGLAVTTWSEHARELRRLADVVEEVLGPSAPWDWSESTFNRLRDRLIADVKSSEEPTAAPRKLRRVHKLLQLYIRATRILQNHFTDRDDVARKPRALTIERWLRNVKTAWNTAGLDLSTADQPRYERIEAGKIFIEGTSDRHDPRYRFWLQLGVEGRPGQILRARRYQLEPRSPELKGGIFRGKGTALKHGLTYAPTPAHRAKFEEFLSDGYLREYEALYKRGEIEDYPLFPDGDLDHGIALHRSDVRPWAYRRFLGSATEATGFYAIEKAAGVKNLPGRGPYGLKYTIADLAPLVAGRLGIADSVVINLVTAHDTPGTATKYRREVRNQPSILRQVGRIIWTLREDFMTMALDVAAESEGFANDEACIVHHSVLDTGVRLRSLRGEVVWVPWNALRADGQSDVGVSILTSRGMHWESPDLDEDARELRFPLAGVSISLERMLARARRNDTGDPDDASLIDLSE
jgi:hypothetical protein